MSHCLGHQYLNISRCLSSFSCYCDEIFWKSKLREKFFFWIFKHRLQHALPHGREFKKVETWNRGSHCIHNRQIERDDWMLSYFLYLIQSRILYPKMRSTHINYGIQDDPHRQCLAAHLPNDSRWEDEYWHHLVSGVTQDFHSSLFHSWYQAGPCPWSSISHLGAEYKLD